MPLQLGDFRIIGRIGEGGMGAVYEAVQQKLNRKVAIKVLANRLAQNEVFLERFKREARAAASINHPGLIQVYDIGEQSGVHYYAMEYVDGENLSQRLKRDQAISEEESVEIVLHVAEALREAHEQSVVHRDIKPENILVTSKGQVKVADLGLAKILKEETSMTLTGTGMGSPHFMSPEQAQDACHVDHRADIYSLGITLLMLVTGRRPYSATSPYQLARAHAEQPLPSGKDLGRDLSPEIERLIGKMAAKNPDDRYQTYQELLEDLRHVRGDRLVTITPAKSNEATREVFQSSSASEPSDVSIEPSTFPSANAVADPSVETKANPWLPIAGAIGALALLVFAFQHFAPANTPPPPTEANRFAAISPPSPPAATNPPPTDAPPSSPLEEREAIAFLMGLKNQNVPPLPASIIGVLFPSRTTHESLMYYLPMSEPIKVSPRNLGGPGDATGPQLIKRATEHASLHPTDYRGNILNFLAAHRRAPDREMQAHAHQQVDHYVRELEQAARREMNRFALEMQLLVEEGKPADAYEVWRQFPQDLNIFKLQPEIYDLIGTNIPPAYLGADYGITPIPATMRPGTMMKQFPHPKLPGHRPHRHLAKPN